MKIRGVGGNERSREVENVFFPCFFYLLQYFLFYFFWKRYKKGVCGSGDGKKLEKSREYLFLFSVRVRIYTHIL